MTQTVKFDNRTWARLVTMAHQQNTTIAELIEQGTRHLLTGKVPTPIADTPGMKLARTRKARTEAITALFVRLRNQGANGAAIANMTGYSKTYVSRTLINHDTQTAQTEEQAA